MSTSHKSSISKYSLSLSLFVAITLFSSLCACNKSNPFKAGDKVFLTKKLLNRNKRDGFNVNLCQLIEPINGQGETFINYSPWAISVDSLLKLKSANLGSFQYTILKKKRKEHPSPMNFYAIIPNKRALIKTYSFHDVLPPGYKYASDKFFIFPSLTSTEETILNK